MKRLNKNPKKQRKSTKIIRQKPKSSSVICANGNLFSHLRLASKNHTGKLIHFRHTSHLLLLLILLVLGIVFFYISKIEDGSNVLGSHSVSVTATVLPSATNIDIDKSVGNVDTPIKIEGTDLATGIFDSNLSKSWLDVSVPIYLLLLAAIIGFWIGDLFDRYFGLSKHRHKITK
jgi:hypothetical protein